MQNWLLRQEQKLFISLFSIFSYEKIDNSSDQSNTILLNEIRQKIALTEGIPQRSFTNITSLKQIVEKKNFRFSDSEMFELQNGMVQKIFKIIIVEI